MFIFLRKHEDLTIIESSITKIEVDGDQRDHGSNPCFPAKSVNFGE